MKCLADPIFDHLTRTWVKPGRTPIPDEHMQRIMRPDASILDLFFVLKVIYKLQKLRAL